MVRILGGFLDDGFWPPGGFGGAMEVSPALDGPRRARAQRASRSMAAAFPRVCMFFLGVPTPLPFVRLRSGGAGALLHVPVASWGSACSFLACTPLCQLQGSGWGGPVLHSCVSPGSACSFLACPPLCHLQGSGREGGRYFICSCLLGARANSLGACEPQVGDQGHSFCLHSLGLSRFRLCVLLWSLA